MGKEGCCQLQPSCFPIGQWKMRCDGWTDVVGYGMPGSSLMGQRMKENTIGSQIDRLYPLSPTAIPSRVRTSQGVL